MRICAPTDKGVDVGLVNTDIDLEEPASIVGGCSSEVDGVYVIQGPVYNIVKLHNDGCAKSIDHAEPPSTAINSVAIAGAIDRAKLVIGECVFEIPVHRELERISDLSCPLFI